MPTPLPKSRRVDENGFTFLEILMAMAILSVLFTLVTMTFHTAMRTINIVEERSQTFHSGRVTFSLFQNEVQSAVLPSPFQKTNFVGIPQTRQGKAIDRISFDSYNHRRFPGSLPGTDPVTFDWWVEEELIFHRETPTLFGRVKPLDPLEFSQGTQIELTSNMFPLSNKVESFELRYVKQNQWVNQWSSAGAGTLPRAVSMELALQLTNGDIQKFSTIISLPHGHQEVL